MAQNALQKHNAGKFWSIYSHFDNDEKCENLTV